MASHGLAIWQRCTPSVLRYIFEPTLDSHILSPLFSPLPLLFTTIQPSDCPLPPGVWTCGRSTQASWEPTPVLCAPWEFRPLDTPRTRILGALVGKKPASLPSCPFTIKLYNLDLPGSQWHYLQDGEKNPCLGSHINVDNLKRIRALRKE